jgi:hypothetical protein
MTGDREMEFYPELHLRISPYPPISFSYTAYSGSFFSSTLRNSTGWLSA